MSKHPIPEEGVVRYIASEQSDLFWRTPDDANPFPVLVLPCDENGETEHSRILKGLAALRREYEKATRGCKHPGNEYWEEKFMEYFARIDAEIGGRHD